MSPGRGLAEMWEVWYPEGRRGNSTVGYERFIFLEQGSDCVVFYLGNSEIHGTNPTELI